MFVLFLFILIPHENHLMATCHGTNLKVSKMFEHVVNSLPEINKPLSAKYVKSFAYPTFKERVPAIIQGIADALKNKEEIKEKYGEEALQEVDIIIEKILNLKNSMQSDKPLEEIKANGKFSKEVNTYNKLLKEKQLENAGKPPTWFQTEWLFAECYTYFKLHEIFYISKTMNKYDPFMKVKNDTFLGSKSAIVKLSKYIAEVRANGSLNEKEKKETFVFLLKCSLWGNKADLSLSGGKAVAASEDIYTEMNKFDQYILVNDLEETYEILKDNTHGAVVDIVLDNAGYELYNDLCFADFLVHSGLVKKVIFHGKAIPWFVSDVTLNDFNYIFDLLLNHVSKETASLAKEWGKYLENGQWVFSAESFWILPHDYSKMASVDPELYAKLGENKLVIFKGDLNYRKLVGDIYWDPTTSFEKALRGFAPTNILALRTVKADTISGLKKGIFEELTQRDPSWLITGQYALIQLLKKK